MYLGTHTNFDVIIQKRTHTDFDIIIQKRYEGDFFRENGFMIFGDWAIEITFTPLLWCTVKAFLFVIENILLTEDLALL